MPAYPVHHESDAWRQAAAVLPRTDGFYACYIIRVKPTCMTASSSTTGEQSSFSDSKSSPVFFHPSFARRALSHDAAHAAPGW
jgi:hypothetical protein